LTPIAAHWKPIEALFCAPPDAPSLVPLPGLGGVLFSGPDAEAFLQSQLSNDLARLKHSNSISAAYCSPKGRVLALQRLLRWDGSILALLPKEIMPSFIERISMYVLRSKVVIDTLPESCLPAGLLGTVDQLPATLARVDIDCEDRCVLIGPAQGYADLARDHGQQIGMASASRWQTVCIEHGEAQVYQATSGLFTPQMLNLDHTGAICFHKGCYPGQEIVARTHYLGRPKQRMFRARCAPGTDVGPGMRIVTDAPAQQLSGHVVRADSGSGRLLVSIRIRDHEGAVRIDTGETMLDINAVDALLPITNP